MDNLDGYEMILSTKEIIIHSEIWLEFIFFL